MSFDWCCRCTTPEEECLACEESTRTPVSWDITFTGFGTEAYPCSPVCSDMNDTFNAAEFGQSQQGNCMWTHTILGGGPCGYDRVMLAVTTGYLYVMWGSWIWLRFDASPDGFPCDYTDENIPGWWRYGNICRPVPLVYPTCVVTALY